MATALSSVIPFEREKLEDQTLIALYKGMLLPRMIEEKMLKLLRQGKISKWFSGIGQEAISVGATLALLDDEIIFPMHRNLGVFTTRQVPLTRLFAQWQGKESGFTKGRDRSFHFGSLEHHIVGMISHLGPQLSLSAGVALAHKLKNENRISLAFTGEGGTSEGEFHEALNVAAVWQLPVIFLVENNGYGLSTPINQQFKCVNIADKGIGYGMRSISIDGNNIIEVFETISSLAAELRKNPEPVLVECMTFRQRGHEEASGVKYVPKELLDYWIERDPKVNFEQWLLTENIISESEIDTWAEEIKTQINQALEEVSKEDDVQADLNNELADLYSPSTHTVTLPTGSETKNSRFIEAITDGLDLAMQRHEDLVLMGQDIADYGGVFKITNGFLEKYGEARIRNTPLCESAIIGIGLGLSLKGIKSVIEMQFADFVTCGFNQIVNNLAKIHYRWGATADLVIRMPCGGGVGAGPFHSQTNEAWFFKTPGLKIVYPSNPQDAKALLLAAIEDPNPVLYFEHKALYRSMTAEIPVDYYTEEIGKAAVVKDGNQAVIITYGLGVKWAMDMQQEKNLDIAILDLRSLSPLDYNAIDDVVKQTNKVLLLHEDTLIGGIGAELSAYISEHLFEHLDAPIMRVASLDTPFPFAKNLEAQYLANSRLEVTLKKLLSY
jgi:2-oxoisovalerate dehydrogenase E1 component